MSFASSGCVLESGKEVKFCPDDDGFEHLLDLRMVTTYTFAYNIIAGFLRDID